MTKYLYILVFCFLSISGIAQNTRYNFGHINYTHGLSQNHIHSFEKDNNGFLWIGTASGLNRYDGYEIKTFKNNERDSTSIPNNTVQSLTKDQFGRLWIGLPNGFCLFNPNTEQFSSNFNITSEGLNFDLYNINLVVPSGDSILFFRIPGIGIIKHNIYTNYNKLIRPNPNDSLSIYSVNITYMEIYNNTLYIIYGDGTIDLLNTGSCKVLKRNVKAKDFFNTNLNYVLFVDNDKNIWVYCRDQALGILMISHSKILHFNTESTPALNSNIITILIQDTENNYWIGTDHGGLNILSNNLKRINYIVHESNNENSISQDVITSIYKSDDDIIWIGTFKQGVNFYHKNFFSFYHYINHPNNPNSLTYNDVNCFVEDKKGNIWIGTNGKGLIYFDRKTNKFTNIMGKPGENFGLKSNVIVTLFIDKAENLWIGTYHGGLTKYDGKKFINYNHNPDNPNSINDNKIWDIYEDSHGNLWIGTLIAGLDLFNKEKKIFHHYTGTGINQINSNFIMDINEDKYGNIWFASDNGIFVLDWKTLRFTHYSHNSENEESISSNFVYNVFKDLNGNIWAGTRDGLNLFIEKTNTFKTFTTNNGLADNSIMSILQSNNGDLWLGTLNGLTKMVISYNEKGEFISHYTVNFNESDGLQGREFNEGSALKTSKGELIFGGYNGFNLFNPDIEDEFHDKYNTHILGLELFGKEVTINRKENERKIIHSTILEGKTIKLKYTENIFSLKFASINYLRAKKINYRYKLEGLNDQWIYTNWQDRKATFTNLNPGKYIFKLQSSDYNSDWNESECFMNLVIMPPWYRTYIAYFIYILILVLLFILFRRMLIQKERNKFQKEEAIKESERQHDLNILKTRFFTNVSHEFRTPLTLIITPLERLIKNNIDSEIKRHLELMLQNAKLLLRLVNQLLDFRKAEENKLKINYIYGNIIGFLQQTIDSFSDFTESKNINLQFIPSTKDLFIQFDKDKIEKIILNLLSNAFKFTQENGYIKIYTELENKIGKEILKITVEDSGIGIKEDNLDKIFDRFYQADLPNKFITKGSGIGLSLTKDFVELHNGTITVESKYKKGTRFILRLPVNRNQIARDPDELSEIDKLSVINDIKEDTPENANDKKSILLVEDNADFRFYLKDSFSERFNILEAENGKKALEIIAVKKLDMIVSDVMMPEIDGFTLCQEIKTNPQFSHIPIILLTAKSTQQDKIDGLKHGADEYITKPFSFEILESRIEYLLSQREKFIKQYQKSFQVESDTGTITPLDAKLLKKALKLISENISETDFSVEKLSKELGMSRVYLYKKIMSLTGKTPIELIRLVRLKKAAELLIKSQLTISEITYEVGFSDPRYFSKLFKTEYNVLPSKYKENQGLIE